MIIKSNHATASHVPFLPKDNFWYIYLDIIKSEVLPLSSFLCLSLILSFSSYFLYSFQRVGKTVSSLLAIVPRDPPGVLGTTITSTLEPQYKQIFEHFRSIDQLRFSILTESGKICDMTQLTLVLHFKLN